LTSASRRTGQLVRVLGGPDGGQLRIGDHHWPARPVELYIDTNDREASKAYFDALKAREAELTAALSRSRSNRPTLSEYRGRPVDCLMRAAIRLPKQGSCLAASGCVRWILDAGETTRLLIVPMK
jgi:hypothetical protein